jgi:hypothetical protein
MTRGTELRIQQKALLCNLALAFISQRLSALTGYATVRLLILVARRQKCREQLNATGILLKHSEGDSQGPIRLLKQPWFCGSHGLETAKRFVLELTYLLPWVNEVLRHVERGNRLLNFIHRSYI